MCVISNSVPVLTTSTLQHVLYQIFDKNKTCTASPLKGDFVPISIPGGASLLGQAVLGSSSGPGQGLLVNTWVGDTPDVGGQRA